MNHLSRRVVENGIHRNQSKRHPAFRRSRRIDPNKTEARGKPQKTERIIGRGILLSRQTVCCCSETSFVCTCSLCVCVFFQISLVTNPDHFCFTPFALPEYVNGTCEVVHRCTQQANAVEAAEELVTKSKQEANGCP